MWNVSIRVRSKGTTVMVDEKCEHVQGVLRLVESTLEEFGGGMVNLTCMEGEE